MRVYIFFVSGPKFNKF